VLFEASAAIRVSGGSADLSSSVTTHVCMTSPILDLSV
jgi:hypothetical protein